MTEPIPLPPIERLNELLEIVPIAESQFKIQSGLVWKVDRTNRTKAGSVAGTRNPDSKTPGRFDWRVRVDERQYYVSRLIYFMANGVDPGELEVDHEDWNPMNNNVWNLRLLTSSPQKHNRRPQSNNKSGVVGVCWHKKAKKWKAELMYKGEKFYLGLHTCLIDAARVWNNKIIELELDKIGKPLHDTTKLTCTCSNCVNAPRGFRPRPTPSPLAA
jgi:hypothetical protein